ncbi:uncharacterized protein LOC121933630 [Sceloporus undulatus]|uniref:uncharacterized protein LOC121933630 n=1 Tax=Sceloporus undulatus TaxID=8520 RepID=UPI001C4DBD70|nr:uncharacterized protein LOC121933630 [Sceloporus undulatus]
MVQIFLIWLALSIVEESSGQIAITQTPTSLQRNLGDRVTIQCKAASSVTSSMHFYQLTPGQNPKLLIAYATRRFEWTPDRFSGSGSGTDFTFTINGVRLEDEGEYFCSQSYGSSTQYHLWNKENSWMNNINMFQIFLISLTMAMFEASNGQIVITQTPAFMQANSGDKFTIRCQASSSMGSYMALYQFLANQKPKLLIYDVTNRFEGTPDRFSGSGSGTDFTFTINGVRPEDEAVYYCGQRQSYPLHMQLCNHDNMLFIKLSLPGKIFWEKRNYWMNSIIIMLQISLIWLTLSLLKESSGQIVITQTPASTQVQPGDRVDIQCIASSSMSNDMQLYQFIPGQKPKLLMYNGSSRFTGTPDRFSGSYSGTTFTFTINGVRPEDQAEYYCGQDYSTPYTFGAGTKLEIKQRDDAAPVAFIFPPSKEQLKTNSATVVCLISSFYPSELNVIWKVDGKAATGDIQTSAAAADTDKTYKLSSTLTLSTEEYNSHESYTCEVTHKTLSQPLVKNFKRSECPS